MFSSGMSNNQVFRWKALVLMAILAISALAFGQTAPASQTTPADEKQQQTKPNQSTVPEAGGPQGEIGPMAIPKKKEEPPPERAKPPKMPEGMPAVSISVNVPMVQVPVMVLTKNGQFIPGLKQEHFKIYEDGVPQTISSFSQHDRPITAVLLVEFAAINYYFMVDALNAAYAFTQMLKKDDWVAVVSYDMKPHILVDFTQDKRSVQGAINSLRIPGFSETNVFDALNDTIDRIENIEGHKYIILVGTGLDTFSKLHYDQILRRVRSTKDISIFAVGTGRAFREWYDARYGNAPWVRVDLMSYTQAENQLNTFSRMTGGKAYFPRFEGELNDIFRDVSAAIRNEYVLAYRPTNNKQDGTYRKLKVELTGGPNGGPLKVVDEKGKEMKVTIVSREGYTAKHEVE